MTFRSLSHTSCTLCSVFFPDGLQFDNVDAFECLEDLTLTQDLILLEGWEVDQTSQMLRFPLSCKLHCEIHAMKTKDLSYLLQPLCNSCNTTFSCIT